VVPRSIFLLLGVAAAAFAGCDVATRKTPAANRPGPARGADPAHKAPSEATPAQQDRRPRIIFLGDSLTAGLGLDVEQSFPALIEAHGHLDVSELRERILREIEAFAGGADQNDDVTMILMKVEEDGAHLPPVHTEGFVDV